MRNLSFPPAPYALPVKLSNNEGMGQTVLASPKLVTPVCNLCPGWLLCLMHLKGLLQFIDIFDAGSTIELKSRIFERRFKAV